MESNKQVEIQRKAVVQKISEQQFAQLRKKGLTMDEFYQVTRTLNRMAKKVAKI